MKKRYSISKEQCNCELFEFFDNIAKIAGETGDISKLKYDCCNICVTKSVQNQIKKYYETRGCVGEQFATFWLLLGPKANLDCDGYEVEIEDGFIIRG